MTEGHNAIAGDHLRTFIERVERLDEEKQALTIDIREVYAEAKSSGFDVKIIRKLVAERRVQETERDEQRALLDMYRDAIDFKKTPLGRAANG
jgi:uncharacterized protein (UPF0335 family)